MSDPFAEIIDALTVDHIENEEGDDITLAVPLLERSIAFDLRLLAANLGGSRLLEVTADCIDHALLAAEEARLGKAN